MFDFIKKNIYLILLFIITLSIGFLTFLTFIDKSFIELSNQNLQYLLPIVQYISRRSINFQQRFINFFLKSIQIFLLISKLRVLRDL